MTFLQTQTNAPFQSRTHPTRIRTENVEVDDIICVDERYFMLVQSIDMRWISGCRIEDGSLVSAAYDGARTSSWYVQEEFGGLAALIVRNTAGFPHYHPHSMYATIRNPRFNLSKITDKQDVLAAIVMHPDSGGKLRGEALGLIREQSLFAALVMHPDFDTRLIPAAFARIQDQELKDRFVMTQVSARLLSAYYEDNPYIDAERAAIARATDIDLLLRVLRIRECFRDLIFDRIALMKCVGLCGFSDENAALLRRQITYSIESLESSIRFMEGPRACRKNYNDYVLRVKWLKAWL